MHLSFELLKYVLMMVVCMSKQSIKSANDREQVLCTVCWDCYSRVEILTILKNGGTVVYRMNHIIDG